MAWKFDSVTPIFKQIVDEITLRIIKGDYPMGEKLSSVRDLAVEAGVNPNTMQRALAEIELTGLVETKRGDGRYITENGEIISKFKSEYIGDNAKKFLKLMNEFGFTKEDVIDYLQKTNF